MKKNVTALLVFITVFISYQPNTVQAQWEQMTLPTYGTPVYCLAATDTNLFDGDDYAIYRSSDFGGHWDTVNTGLVYPSALSFAISGTNIFLGTNGSGSSGDVFLSTDNGRHWNSISSTNTAVKYINALAVSGAYIYAGTNGAGIYLTSDNGQHWNSTGAYDGLMTAFAVSGENVFAANKYAGVTLTTDNGGHWVSRNTSLNATVTSFAVSGTNIFAGTHGGSSVFLSSDDGLHWSATNAAIANTYVNALAVTDSKIVAGTNGGVFFSADNGGHWNSINTGLTDTNIYSLAVCGTYLFAGTYSHGVWRLPLSALVTEVNEKQPALPTSPTLINYPNPFSAATTISYSLTEREPVELAIYNSLGERIALLTHGVESAGTHSAAFNASDLQNGIYFYRLTAGKLTQTGKMAIIR